MSILGFRLQRASLVLAPRIPQEWPRFERVFVYRSARYEISVENAAGVSRGVAYAEPDGKMHPDDPNSADG